MNVYPDGNQQPDLDTGTPQDVIPNHRDGVLNIEEAMGRAEVAEDAEEG